MKFDPFGTAWKEMSEDAMQAAEAIVAEYKGTAFSSKADKIVSLLKVDKAVVAELKARKDLEAIKKIEAVLNAQGGSFDPTDPTFQRKYAPQLKQLKAAFEQMKKNHPKARATEEAEKIAKEFLG